MGGNTGRRTKSERMNTRHRSAHFGEALAYANELHAGQTRKGTSIPYISHLLAVASLAFEYGADEDEAIAALLHDAVEDQGGAETLQQIDSRFGSTVDAPASCAWQRLCAVVPSVIRMFELLEGDGIGSHRFGCAAIHAFARRCTSNTC